MIVVTGGAGLIGSNVIKALNAKGHRDILVVDNLKDGRKMMNLADLDIVDYRDKEDFIKDIRDRKFSKQVTAVFHLGACSATTEWDGLFIMRNNFEYSKTLLHWCQEIDAQYLYASSASVYGLADKGFEEVRACEKPINMYAFSKFQFDQYVRSVYDKLTSQVVGFRYFNVYGPREAHKGSMASTAYHFNKQILDTGVCNIFEGTDGYGNGEQQRDFVFVEDCADVNLWFFEHSDKSGIFNVGTGRAQSFNDVAKTVVNWHNKKRKVNASMAYVPFPEHLKGAYQSFTQADITALRNAGYDSSFHTVEEGVTKYLDWLNV